MGKLRGPRWDANFERWKKILCSWLRVQDKSQSDSEFVAAVILGLSDSSKLKSGENVADIILDLDDNELYPTTRNYSEELDNLEKFQLKDGQRSIPGLTAIIQTYAKRY